MTSFYFNIHILKIKIQINLINATFKYQGAFNLNNKMGKTTFKTASRDDQSSSP